jgi:hypothetical protein
MIAEPVQVDDNGAGRARGTPRLAEEVESAVAGETALGVPRDVGHD